MNVLSGLVPTPRTSLGLAEILGAALQAGDRSRGAPIRHRRPLARVVAFTWQIQTRSGTAAIEAALAPTLARTSRRTSISPPAGSAAARAARRHRLHRGGLRVRDRVRPRQRRRAAGRKPTAKWRAWTVVTTLEELNGHPTAGRRGATRDSRDFGGDNWLDRAARREATPIATPRC